MGYYPFFMDSSEFTYAQRVERLVLSVIDIDIPAVTAIEYETQLKLKKLLVVLAEQVPFVPNMTNLSRDVEVTRNQLMKFFTFISNLRESFPFTSDFKQIGAVKKKVSFFGGKQLAGIAKH